MIRVKNVEVPEGGSVTIENKDGLLTIDVEGGSVASNITVGKKPLSGDDQGFPSMDPELAGVLALAVGCIVTAALAFWWLVNYV